MHLLLRLALRACPADFRREYQQTIAQDVRSRELSALAAAADLVCQGMLMRGESLWRDVVLGARSLAKAPVFTGVSIATIALAIGVNITAFSILKGVLLDPLPYAHANRLALVSVTRRGVDQVNIDYPDAHDFSERSRTFESIAVETATRGALTGTGRPVELSGAYVDGTYFRVLGEKAEIGRVLTARDVGTRNAMISDALWRSRFDADTSVLGRHIEIDARDYTVVGVAPPHALVPGPGFMAVCDYWIPIDPQTASWRGNYSFFAIGLRKAAATWPQAQADLSRVAAQLARQYPNFDKGDGVRVAPLSDVLRSTTRPIVLVLYGAALLVLLIAAANMANLLLARTAARAQEIGVRSALGATRRRIAAQYVVENGLAALAGLAGAIVLSLFVLRCITGFLTLLGQAYGTNMTVPGWEGVGLNPIVFLYGAALTMLFTLATVVLAVYAHAADSGASRRRLRAALTICEVALAFAVLTTAALLMRSFVLLEQRPTGFTENNAYSVQVDLPLENRYAGPAMVRFYERAERRLRALPAVAAASEAYIAGLSQESSTNYALDRAIQPNSAIGQGRFVAFNSVDTGFFQTLRIPILSGRSFSAADTGTSLPVAVVSRTFAIEHFGGVSAAVGKYVSVGQSTSAGFPLRRIVGVAGDVRHSLSEPAAAEVYTPFTQVSFPGAFIVRTRGNDPHLAAEVARVFAGLDPLLPPPHVLSFAVLRSIDDATQRMAAAVLLALGGAALLLALVGIYGVVAYNVERRTHEFGIRMALGARARDIALRVLRDAAILGIIGIAIGTALAALAGRALDQMLFQTSPFDAVSYAAAAALMLAAIAASTLLPALRAMRVEPAVALRYE